MSKKIFFRLLSLLPLVAMAACGQTHDYAEPDDQDLSLRTLVNKYYRSSSFLVGAMPGPSYLTDQNYAPLRQIYFREFTLGTPVDEFNQSVVYPRHDRGWHESYYSHFFELARKHKQQLWVDTSLSPACSEWLRDEQGTSFTVETLSEVMSFYLTTIGNDVQNNNDVVKWMTVVKNPVSAGHTGLDYNGAEPERGYNVGEWLGPVAGVGYEMPWTALGFSSIALTGLNLNEPRIPNYIVEAFGITNAHTPGVRQLIAQADDRIDDRIWNTIKALVLALRENGFRVDGIGWIASLDLEQGFDLSAQQRLSMLIDWCYLNNFEFHIAQLEVKALPVNRWDVEDLDGLPEREEAVSQMLTTIAEIIAGKIGKGVTTLSYGVFDGRYVSQVGTYANLFARDGSEGLAYAKLKETLTPTPGGQ